MTGTVLVPFDGSPLSRKALGYALRVFPDATVTVLHVVDVYEPFHEPAIDGEGTYEPLMGSEEWYEHAGELSQRVLDEARTVAESYDRDVDTESEIGDPGRIAVEYANEEDVDHVVLGVHGRADEARDIYGSVADVVARRATVPVTVVR